MHALTGRREQKKEETRALLLEKARDLFESKGFERVTTAEIARATGIAEGTLFNYYRSKGDLFIAAVMPPEPTEGGEPSDIVLHELSPHDAAAATVALLDRYLNRLRQVDKRLLRDYFTIVYSHRRSDAAAVRNHLFEADEQIIRRMAGFFATQKEAHPTQMAGFNAELAASCIFHCAAALLSQYVLLEDWTYDAFMEAVYDQALFILEGHM